MRADVFTQRVFLVSPTGDHMAYAAPRDQLRVRGASGAEQVVENVRGQDVRFSADGRRLVTLRRLQEAGDLSEVLLLDLASGERRGLGQAYQPRWLEWVQDGVVVRHVDPLSNRPALTYFPLSGAPRRLVSRDDLGVRFTAASRGTRVLFFAGRSVLTVDVSGGQPADAGELESASTNMEMRPDGGEAAIVTGRGVHRWTPAGLQLIDPLPHVHTVWYAGDGRSLAYASPSRAVHVTGGLRHELHAPSTDLRALRFRRGGDGLVVVRGDRALLWRPAAGDLRTLATSGAGRTLHAADWFRGGTLMWTLGPLAAANARLPAS
ncbi:MAG TPA: hypothetical protein VNO33_09205 [Kofleriaceae bacterium]|nr:hypothetical protein [Kofleriaceae bacterium]